MGLYERLMGLGPDPRIPIHYFSATMSEFARGRITGAQAQAIVSTSSGAPLTAAEITEANTLLGTISGSAAVKLARAKEIDDVLMLAEREFVPYNTPTLVKTRLGV